MNNLPIGMFDSGIGGLTLFSQLTQAFPKESFYYLADTAHFPYGTKSHSQLINLSLRNTTFLLEQNVKAIVIACFTASAIAYESILSITDLPVISVIDSLIDEFEKFESQNIALLATQATIGSGIIQQRLFGRRVYSYVASQLVAAIENREDPEPLLEEYRKEFLINQIDTVLLACTHFAHVESLMRQVWGDKIAIVDSSASVISKVSERIPHAECKIGDKLFTTGDPHLFQNQCERFINESQLT